MSLTLPPGGGSVLAVSGFNSLTMKGRMMSGENNLTIDRVGYEDAPEKPEKLFLLVCLRIRNPHTSSPMKVGDCKLVGLGEGMIASAVFQGWSSGVGVVGPDEENKLIARFLVDRQAVPKEAMTGEGLDELLLKENTRVVVGVSHDDVENVDMPACYCCNYVDDHPAASPGA